MASGYGFNLDFMAHAVCFIPNPMSACHARFRECVFTLTSLKERKANKYTQKVSGRTKFELVIGF